MTLFELLHKVSFEALIPTLKDVYNEENDIYPIVKPSIN